MMYPYPFYCDDEERYTNCLIYKATTLISFRRQRKGIHSHKCYYVYKISEGEGNGITRGTYKIHIQPIYSGGGVSRGPQMAKMDV